MVAVCATTFSVRYGMAGNIAEAVRQFSRCFRVFPGLRGPCRASTVPDCGAVRKA